MASPEHLQLLHQGAATFNQWRADNPGSGIDLRAADLRAAHLSEADLRGALLSEADLGGADLASANLEGAKLDRAVLRGAYMAGAAFRRAILTEADLRGATLVGADFSQANLVSANLAKADLTEANLTRADLRSADLTFSTLVRTKLDGADLSGCRVFGVSAWALDLTETTQADLLISAPNQPEITVDNLNFAQFIYLLLTNERVRHVIDTITSKLVLILGRFTPERRVMLDAIREELRKRDYTPVLFNFDKPVSRDLLGTVEELARMARFVIADITEANSVTGELQAIVPHLPNVPIQPLLRTGSSEYDEIALFGPLKAYPSVLELFEYGDVAEVPLSLHSIIESAEAKALELRGVSPPTE